jgi:hypothetical protein
MAGMVFVSAVEDNPKHCLTGKDNTEELIEFELLMELDALNYPLEINGE